jgi:hypothetical protein
VFTATKVFEIKTFQCKIKSILKVVDNQFIKALKMADNGRIPK